MLALLFKLPTLLLFFGVVATGLVVVSVASGSDDVMPVSSLLPVVEPDVKLCNTDVVGDECTFDPVKDRVVEVFEVVIGPVPGSVIGAGLAV